MKLTCSAPRGLLTCSFIIVTSLVAGCDVPQTSEDAAATIAADARDAGATAGTAGESALGTAEVAGGEMAQTAAAAGRRAAGTIEAVGQESVDAAGTEVKEVEVEIGVSHGFTSDVEIRRTEIAEILDDLEAENSELDLAPIRATVAAIEAELERLEADVAGADKSDLVNLVDRLEVEVADLVRSTPHIDFSQLERSVEGMRSSVDE